MCFRLYATQIMALRRRCAVRMEMCTYFEKRSDEQFARRTNLSKTSPTFGSAIAHATSLSLASRKMKNLKNFVLVVHKKFNHLLDNFHSWIEKKMITDMGDRQG